MTGPSHEAVLAHLIGMGAGMALARPETTRIVAHDIMWLITYYCEQLHIPYPDDDWIHALHEETKQLIIDYEKSIRNGK